MSECNHVPCAGSTLQTMFVERVEPCIWFTTCTVCGRWTEPCLTERESVARAVAGWWVEPKNAEVEG